MTGKENELAYKNTLDPFQLLPLSNSAYISVDQYSMVGMVRGLAVLDRYGNAHSKRAAERLRRPFEPDATIHTHRHAHAHTHKAYDHLYTNARS